MYMDPQYIQYQAPHPNVDPVEIISPEQAQLLQPTMVSFDKATSRQLKWSRDNSCAGSQVCRICHTGSS